MRALADYRSRQQAALLILANPLPGSEDLKRDLGYCSKERLIEYLLEQVRLAKAAL